MQNIYSGIDASNRKSEKNMWHYLSRGNVNQDVLAGRSVMRVRGSPIHCGQQYCQISEQDDTVLAIILYQTQVNHK